MYVFGCMRLCVFRKLFCASHVTIMLPLEPSDQESPWGVHILPQEIVNISDPILA